MKKILPIFIFLCAVPTSQAFGYTYSTIDLGMLDLGAIEHLSGEPYPVDVYATAINNSGTVVGTVRQAWASASFLNDGEIHIIHRADMFNYPSFATDINDAGSVVGRTQTDEMAVFIYDKFTTYTFDGFATGINNEGVIVGSAGYFYPYPFLYEGRSYDQMTYNSEILLINNDGKMYDLRNSGIDFIPTGINNSGMLIGGSNPFNEYSFIDEYWHSTSGQGTAYYFHDGTLENIGTLGGSGATAIALNNIGMIVGGSFTPDDEVHAYLYYDGLMNDLGTIGGNFSTARGINESGMVVGSSTNAIGEERAFVYDGTSMFDLNSRLNLDSLGITLNNAVAINDFGMIAANGVVDGLNRAFLVKPDWDATVTTAQAFLTNYLTLGETFSFDYYWKMNNEPTHANFDVLFFNGTGWETFGWALNHSGSSVDWASASFYVPEWVQGQNVQIMFSLIDVGQPTGPTVYLRNIASTAAPTPEPSTLLLFGTGLAGLAAIGRRKRK